MRILLLSIFILLQQNLFALVSIAPVEIGADAGFSTKIGASLETKRGNTHKDNYKGVARFTYDNNVSFVTWAEISGEYGESNKIRDTKKAFAHIRHINATPSTSLNVEFFGQMQDDEFKLIQNRSLIGAGVRYKLHKFLENGSGFFGLGGFHEQIRYSSNDPKENNERLNAYFAYAYSFNQSSNLSYNFYYQPKFDAFEDAISFHTVELKLSILEQLYLQFTLNYEEDTRPVNGVKKYDFTQNTAFVLEF